MSLDYPIFLYNDKCLLKVFYLRLSNYLNLIVVKHLALLYHLTPLLEVPDGKYTFQRPFKI